MSKVKIQGNASGTGVVTLTAPNTNTDRTITLPDGDISLGVGIDDNATSTAITIDASENVEINTGNLIIGTSGKGIDFSANGNAAGMTSEVLDDYEEGTWTPTHTDGTTLGIVGVARYTKIGNAVTINIDVQFTKASAGISGLPFTSTTNTNQTFNVGYSATSNNHNYAHMNASGATISAWYNVVNGGVAFVNGDRVMVGGTYFTDS